MPHHPVFKKSSTTPVRIVFNASSKPTDGISLNDCLLTGPSLTAKLHDILLTFHQGKLSITANISKAFHRIIERIGITQENLSPSERETISIVRSSLEKSHKGYIVRLPFKDESRPSINYRNAKGQLNFPMQRVSHNEILGKQYEEIVNS